MPRRSWRTLARRPPLSPAMLRYLSIGNTAGSSVGDGHLDAFLLRGKVETFLHVPPARTRPDIRAAIAAVRELYEIHGARIEEAARVATAGEFLSYARRILYEADRIARDPSVDHDAHEQQEE